MVLGFELCWFLMGFAALMIAMRHRADGDTVLAGLWFANVVASVAAAVVSAVVYCLVGGQEEGKRLSEPIDDQDFSAVTIPRPPKRQSR